MSNIEDLVKSISVMKLELGDVLVVQVDPTYLNQAEIASIERAVKKTLPEGVKVLFTTPGITLGVVRLKDKHSAAAPDQCVCGGYVSLTNVRWNGEYWEHTTDPRAGHHPMTEAL